MKYIDIARQSYSNYAGYFWREVTTPHWGNYFYWLIAISLLVYALELMFPWRKNQASVRKDFWLDGFYMFFNFFIFSLIAYNAFSDVAVTAFNDLLASVFGIRNLVAIEIKTWPYLSQLFVLFIVRDFVQWNVHRLLHAVPRLWEFHKVHHSVEQMGFAAHLRYHFMETVVYRSFEYLPLAMIGFGITDFLWVHLFTILIGHLNHANVYLPIGPLKYIFNTPQMHIWHHVKELPKGSSGINYGITLSIWDYIFGTAHIPHDGRDIALGFDHIESYPQDFVGQAIEPFRGHK